LIFPFKLCSPFPANRPGPPCDMIHSVLSFPLPPVISLLIRFQFLNFISNSIF
jgi:hypothetical protein